jgi:hypothetical protein
MDKTYARLYKNYLNCCRPIPMINNPDKHLLFRKILSLSKKERVKVIDYACGEGSRLLEFHSLFLYRINFKCDGYDSNQAWKSDWLNNMYRDGFPCRWLDSKPKANDYDIIHCSHAVYFADVTDEIIKLWEKQSECQLLIIRATDKSSFWNFFNDYNWEIILKRYVRKKGFNYKKIQLDSYAVIPDYLIINFASSIQTITKTKMPKNQIIDILRCFLIGNNIILPNKDVVYIIYK